MLQNQSLRVLDVDEEAVDDQDDTLEVTADDLAAGVSRYEAADDVDVSRFEDNYTFPRFIDAVLHEFGKDFSNADARLVDEVDDPEDIHFGGLLVFPDESLMFVGSDPTAKDSIPWFSFVIERHEPMPAPETARDALDLLRPPSVQDLVYEEDFLPARHGEWFLIPTTMIPVGTVFEPGVSSDPMGPSPLGNHVPTQYAFTTSDHEFMAQFHDDVDRAPDTISTPPEVIDWTWQQIRKPATADDAPGWADIRSWAGDVLVQGTIRHRDDDHFVESCTDGWYKAVTHDVEVYTGDGVAERVHLDYHGR